MTQFPDERAAEMLELFFESAQELLQALNEEALKLEKRPADAELVRSIRRIVHTLKGDAAACGFRELSNAAHDLEDALALESASSHGSLAEVAFTAADTFGAMLAAYRRKGKQPSSAPLARMIRELTQQPKGKKRTKKGAKAAAVPVDWNEYEKLAIQSAASAGRSVYHVTAAIDPKCVMPIAARQVVLNALAPVAEVLGARPEAGSPESTRRLELLVASDKSSEQLSARCRIPTVISSVVVEVVKAAEPSVRKGAPAELAGHGTSTSALHQALPESGDDHGVAGRPNHPVPAENILRVDAERIDTVLNLVGELIIGRSMLQQAFT
ncbi:MAG: Hpt domain-containing protein, partial [Terriglobales bacterium]